MSVCIRVCGLGASCHQARAGGNLLKVNEADAITEFLTRPVLGSPAVPSLSCLWAALRDARPPSGRNVRTGRPNPKQQKKQLFVGAIGYLVAVDLLGKALKLNAGGSTERVRFLAALEDFAPSGVTLSQRDRKALYALRCSFAHNFGVVNVPEPPHRPRANWAPDPELTHHFLLAEDTRRLITYGSLWDGATYPPPAKTATVVNLRRLADLVEAMVEGLTYLHSQARLAIVPPTVGEFRTRFIMGVGPG
jgi:hypothetical protein